MTAGFPSAAGMFLSRVCVPFSVPFSTANVGTTLCQTLAGSAPSKSSEKRSSFFFAMGSAGTGSKSAAKAAAVTKNEKARMMRVFIELLIRGRVLYDRVRRGEQLSLRQCLGVEKAASGVSKDHTLRSVVRRGSTPPFGFQQRLVLLNLGFRLGNYPPEQREDMMSFERLSQQRVRTRTVCAIVARHQYARDA